MNAERYRIRLAGESELAQLQDIERAASLLFQNTKYSFLVGAEPGSLEFLRLQHRSGKVWVVTDSENHPVGFAAAGFIDGSPHLHEVDVLPAHARQGLGTRLINEVVGWARAAGYERLTLSTFRDIPWNAPFYGKLGFTAIEKDDLPAGLVEIRKREHELGLPVDERVCMSLSLVL